MMETYTMSYTRCIRIDGRLSASYSFVDDAAVDAWIATVFPKLQVKYKPLRIAEIRKLDGLQVGDRCGVFGEGMDTFTITGVFLYSPDRPGFALDSGWNEEVWKCFKPPPSWDS